MEDEDMLTQPPESPRRDEDGQLYTQPPEETGGAPQRVRMAFALVPERNVTARTQRDCQLLVVL